MAYYLECPSNSYYEVKIEGDIQCTNSSTDLTSSWVSLSSDPSAELNFMLSNDDFLILRDFTIWMLVAAFCIRIVVKLFNQGASK